MSSTGGRRAGPRTAKQGWGATGVAAVAVAVAAAATALMAGRADPIDPQPTSEPSTIPVERTVQACPRSRAPGGAQTRVLTGSAAVGGLGGEGSVERGPVGADGQDIGLERGSQVTARAGAADGPALVVRAVGELAAGLFTVQADIGRSTVAATQCEPPASDWWFTGAGATLDHSSSLVLTNVDPGPAVLDVRVFGETGEVDTVGTRGITIAPGTQTTIPLTDVAPQGEELAVNVTTSRGRVVAAMADSYAEEEGARRGDEWIPAQRGASRTVRLSGMPPRADTRALLIGNPSTSEALVSVNVAGESGSFAPTEASEIRVPPGTVVSTDVANVVEGADVSVRLRSRVPVVASIRSTIDGDSTYAPAVRPLDAPAATPLLDGTDSRVVLSAGAEPATATATTYDASGQEVESTELEIVAEGTVSWTPRRPAAYVLVAPGQGDVSGAVSSAGDAGVTQLPMSSLPISLRQPVVHPVVTIR